MKWVKVAWILIGLYLAKKLLGDPFKPRKKILPKVITVAVTGCGSGFGKLACITLAKKGCQVFAGCRTQKSCDELSALNIPNLIPVQLDVTQQDQIEKFAKLIETNCPQGLFALINNAGVQQGFLFDWTNLETMRKVIEVNLLGVLSMTKALLPSLKKSKGRLINLGSMGSFYPIFSGSAYTASKHGVWGLTRALKQELHALGIDVILVVPGVFKTEMVNNVPNEIEETWRNTTEEIQQEYGRGYLETLKWELGMMASIGHHPKYIAEALVQAVTSSKPHGLYIVGIEAYLFVYFPLFCDWAIYLTRSSLPNKNQHQILN